jgi:integrase
MTCGYGCQNLDLVVRQEDGSPVKPDSMTQKWERFLKKYNLPKIRLHDLRHSNATALIQAGVSPKVVQQRLGHSDVNITLNTYTHVLPEMDIEAAEKLDDIILKKA